MLHFHTHHAAQILGLSPSSLRGRIRSGTTQAVKDLNGKYTIPLTELIRVADTDKHISDETANWIRIKYATELTV